jgi:hypothetical protein
MSRLVALAFALALCQHQQQTHLTGDVNHGQTSQQSAQTNL